MPEKLIIITSLLEGRGLWRNRERNVAYAQKILQTYKERDVAAIALVSLWPFNTDGEEQERKVRRWSRRVILAGDELHAYYPVEVGPTDRIGEEINFAKSNNIPVKEEAVWDWPQEPEGEHDGN